MAAARGEEALHRYHGLGVDLAEIRILMDLADTALEQGNYRLAAERYLICIEQTGERGEARVIPDALIGIASVATAWGEHRKALLLFGAAQAWHERVGTALAFHRDIARVNRELAFLRDLLGDAETDAVLGEGRALTPAAAITLAATTAPRPETPVPAPAVDTPRLTRRQRDVLRLLAQGRTDREIAAALFIGLRTVSWHVSAILSELGATTRRDAVDRARAAGLL
jgi:DNA-binding CsgD family transcriptional regulator